MKSSLKKDWDFRINTEQQMVIVFQVHRPTTSLARFEKGVLHKLQIQVPLLVLKLTKRIPRYKEKGTLIDISPMDNFNLGKISLKRISLVESSRCGIKLNAFNWCDRWIFYNYVFLNFVDMDILLSSILTMSFFFFFRHWWLLSKPVSKQRNMYRRSEWLQLHLRAWLCRKELLK